MFREQFPYYLAYGMTYSQYWDDDPELCKYYRKAHELRRQEKNEELWLQGLYVYEAICDTSPILHAFAKKGAKPQPYSSKPYALTAERRRKEKADMEKQRYEKNKTAMVARMVEINRRFTAKKEEVNDNGSN